MHLGPPAAVKDHQVAVVAAGRSLNHQVAEVAVVVAGPTLNHQAVVVAVVLAPQLAKVKVFGWVLVPQLATVEEAVVAAQPGVVPAVVPQADSVAY